ncbi:uncharacterized protein [Argopecten irradians]|uniref:uncharacterized protein n=1 Tax=Argopecten irradians TaxID=31199 RepID=UPI00371272DB
MAQISKRYRCLTDFYGSDEELVAKRVLESIITQIYFPAPTFLNLVIKNCNAVEGTSFTEASIYLQLSHESRQAFRTNYLEGYPTCGQVYMKDIVNKALLQEFVEKGVKAIEKHSDACRDAFLSLLEFFHEQKKHESALYSLITAATSVNKKAVTAGLAHHLFSQLIPDKKYEVYKDVNDLLRECGCGCKATICEGNTSIGSRATWHGSVDILLNQTIAVTVGTKSTISAEQVNDGELADDNGDDDDDDANEGEPQLKQRKIENDKNCYIYDDGKLINKQDNVLLDSKVLKQILAEALTNGFAQVNRDTNTLSQFFIPTIGATLEHLTVCMYDCENDVLLHIQDQLELWCPDDTTCYNQLNVTTIVIMWIFLNFTVFTRQNLCNVLDLDRSGLYDKLKESLEWYRKADLGGNFTSQTAVVPPWKYVTPVPKSRKTED